MQPTDKRIATVEQWQALKGVIDGNIGKARVLTADDYNYPVDNPTSVALWLLPAGIYAKTDSSVVVRASTNLYLGLGTFILMPHSGQDQTTTLAVQEGVPREVSVFYTKSSDGTNITGGGRFLLSSSVVDNLTSADTTNPLSARQGKVLKDLIDAIVVPTKTSDLTNDSDFQTGTDVATAVSAVETKLNGNVMTELTMATDATKVEFTETKKNLSTGATSTEVDTIPLASTTQAGILNAAGYQSIIDSQDRLDALAGGAVSIANLSANPSQSDLTTAWQTATGEITVFNRASIFDSTNGKNWTYFDNTSAWEVTGTVNQQITLNNFSLGTAGLIVGDNAAGKIYAEQDGTGSVYGWDALNTRVTNVESATANIPSVVQATGTSTTDVMSQNAVTQMVYGQDSNSNVQIRGTYNYQGNYKVTIGADSVSRGNGSVAIGYNSATGFGVAGAVALGACSSANAQGQMDIGSTNTSYGYNSSNYRLLTGLYDPQSAHDAANKEYVDNLAITYAALNGTTAPTTATAGTYVGQLYLDTTNDKMYYLASIDSTADPVEYNWAEIGGGPNVVQTTGTSTTDVMSQNAATSMVYADPSAKQIVRIGGNAYVSTSSANLAVAIGAGPSDHGAKVQAQGAVALGPYSVASGPYSIALEGTASANGAVAIGWGSSATNAGQVAFNTTNPSYGYNNSNYRLLTGLYDGQNDHDAVTVGQLNTAIAGVSGAAEINATDWSALWQ